MTPLTVLNLGTSVDSFFFFSLTERCRPCRDVIPLFNVLNSEEEICSPSLHLVLISILLKLSEGLGERPDRPLPERDNVCYTFLTFSTDKEVYTCMVTFRCSLYFLFPCTGFLVYLEVINWDFFTSKYLKTLLHKFYKQNSFKLLNVLLYLSVDMF